ncbi:MAG: hypothetical protein U0232_33910 [Thermomicrobiales bacterium]
MVVEEITWSRGACLVLLGIAACLYLPVVWLLLTIPSSRPGAYPLVGVVLLVDLIVIGIIVASYRLRVTLAADTLTVGFGPFRQRVPLAQIVACDPITYGWLEYGGYGIRYKFWQRATMYNVPGDHRRAVRLTLDDGRRVLFSAHDPAAVCAQLRPHCPRCR